MVPHASVVQPHINRQCCNVSSVNRGVNVCVSKESMEECNQRLCYQNSGLKKKRILKILLFVDVVIDKHLSFSCPLDVSSRAQWYTAVQYFWL